MHLIVFLRRLASTCQYAFVEVSQGVVSMVDVVVPYVESCDVGGVVGYIAGIIAEEVVRVVGTGHAMGLVVVWS